MDTAAPLRLPGGRLYTSRQLGLWFAVGMACVVGLQLDRSLGCVVALAVVAAVAYAATTPPDPAAVVTERAGGAGEVLFASDATLRAALAALDEYREYDPAAHAEAVGELRAFYASYGRLLMLPRGGAGELAAQELDGMLDARVAALNVLYTFFLKSPDVPQAFEGAVVRPALAATARALRVLGHKHPRLREQLRRRRLATCTMQEPLMALPR